jgi:DNA-binding NtrC family response regulator
MEKQNSIARLLMVSRDSEVLRVVCKAVEPNLWQLIIASNVWDAMEKLQSELLLDLLIIDLPSGNADDLRCLRWLRQLRPELPILLINRDQQSDAKLYSIQVDSSDYLVTPLIAHRLQAAIQHSLFPAHLNLEKNMASSGIEQPGNGCLFIGASPKLHRLSAQLASLAEADLPVVISGEPGSGKKLVARLLHQMSSRAECAFAMVDCGALSAELLEREIFGCERLRGATAEIARGKLESSPGGTLLLDEIEQMPQQLQSRLANAIESQCIIRPGSSEVVQIDVRVVAASSFSIDRAVSEHRIVPELSRQFEAREIRVPPLRERKDELPLLAGHFMRQLSRKFGLVPVEFSVAMEEAWQSYQWPDNVRELKQEVRRYLIAGQIVSYEEVTAPDQKCEPAQTVQPQPSSVNPPIGPARHSVTDIGGYKSLRLMIRTVREEAERAAITSALEKTGWNRKAAARLLKVSYRSILYKIEQYQMNVPDRSTSSASSALKPFSPGKAEAINADRKGGPAVAPPKAVRSMP